MNSDYSKDGGIVYIETENKPEIGTICTGLKLVDSFRVKGFVRTDEEISCRVTHVVSTTYLKTKFYVIGHRAPTPTPT